MDRQGEGPSGEDCTRSRAEWALVVRAMWAEGGVPPVERLFTAAVREDAHRLAEVLAADIHERTRRAVPWTLEEYARAAPEVLGLAPARRTLLMAAVSAQVDLGATPEARVGVLRSRYPEFSEDLDALLSLTTLLSGVLEVDLALSPGETRGKYDLRERLGAGAFAETWLARDQILGRDVALKIIPVRSWSNRDTDRFLSEARAVARVEHPAVVRLHEAGRFEEDGAYYLDMELVLPGSGARTLAELVQGGPTMGDRAASIASAVAHGLAAAHARGVLHRDIKPANVLLDAASRPRLADFGLAQDVLAPGQPSGGGRLAGTPAYIAPEVAAGQDATPLSDIFSLGATLRALLTGSDPRPPSGAGEALHRAATASLAPVRQEAPQTHPTLAAIVDRACAHAPEGRYGSAGELAADLDAYLSHRPTAARPVGALGRARLWVRRHRAPSGVALVAGVVMLVGSVFFVHGLRRERDAAREAETVARVERDAAVEARDVIQTQNRFISRAFNAARGQRGSGAAGADVTLRETLDMIERRTETAFVDRPLVLGATLQFMAQANAAIGDYSIAERLARRSVETRVAALGQTHPDLISSRCTLADVLLRQRKHDEASPLVRQIIEDIRGTDQWGTADGLWARWALARVDELEGRPDDALRALEALAEEYRVAPFPGSMDFQSVLNDHVRHFIRTHQPERAEAAQREIIGFVSARVGPDDISTLNASRTLVELLRRRGALDEASALNASLLRGYRAILDPGHAIVLSAALVQAEIDIERRVPQAMTSAADVVALTESRPPEHPVRVRARVLLGRAQEATGDLAGAERTLRDAFDAAVISDADRAATGELSSALTRVLHQLGREAEARDVEARFKAWEASARP